MSIDAAEFRRVLGHLASGVAVVTAPGPDGAPCGLTATAVASVSLEPPLVLACVDRGSDTHDCIERAAVFAINILGADGEPLARRFASGSASSVKFDGVAYRSEASGSPILAEALGWADCRLWAAHDGGDHTIFVGEVLAGDAADRDPLVHFRGAYGRPER